MTRSYEKKGRLRKDCWAILLTCLLITFSCLTPSFAANTKTASTALPSVNVLTWWGYLSPPWVKPLVEQTCHVKLSYDEYSTADEFLRRWEDYKDSYDIVIFDDVMYGVIKGDISGKSTHDLSAQAKHYYPAIRAHFYQQHYPNNIAYFYQAISSFLWNPDNIQIEPSDNLYQIFRKAGAHTAAIADDPIVASFLFNPYADYDPLALIKMKQRVRLYVTSDYTNIASTKDFSFAYSDAGTALQMQALHHNKLKISILPQYTFASTDLIAQLNDNSTTTCVADLLTSRSFLYKLMYDSYYFSPYGDLPKMGNSNYLDLYQQYLSLLPTIQWIYIPTISEFEVTNRWWQLMKLSASEQILG